MSYNESLKSNSNYPPMIQSQWDSAPFNEEEIPKKEFDVLISQTLSKSTSVTTDDYVPLIDETEDGDFPYCGTSDTDWKKAYDNEHLTPLELIKEFECFLVKNLQKGYYDNDQEKKQINWLLEECSDWIEDETEVMED